MREAKQEMLATNCADQYVLEEVNIETDPALVERCGLETPAITINCLKLFKYRFTAQGFKRKLERVARSQLIL